MKVSTKLLNWWDQARLHGKMPPKTRETAGKTLKNLRIAEIIQLDMKVENGKVTAYRAKVNLSFKYQPPK